MAQATSGEKPITIEGQKYKVRTQVVYQDGLGTSGTLSTTQPIKYVVQYLPEKSFSNPVPDWINLGERDTTNQNNWIFTNLAGAGFRKELIKNGPNSLTKSLDDATSNALSKSSGLTKQQANQILQVAPNVDPTVVDTNQTLIGTEDFTGVEQIEADNKKTAWRGKIYRYPTKIGENRQDFIKFEVYDYKTRRPSRENPLVQEKDRNLGSQIATIVLPIQPTIVDNNTVDWNGLGLNPVELAGYGLSTAGMTGGSNGNDFGEILGKLGNTITQDSNTQKALLLYLKQKAIGVNGLLSRFGGAIVNPNIELLFQGTQLRPFNFSFRLSPRDKDEAKQVKSIIRVFKEAMSAKTASGGIFLAAPNVFKIRYINGITNDDHTSLNQIKTCALQSCSVDYTPDGSYMTFKDTNSGNPMTSYNLNLQFQELEPVIDTDYKEFTDESTIGY